MHSVNLLVYVGDMSLSLREQKRRATLAAIEEHATTLVATHGFADVTIEQICAAAEISRRTFFNYVDSKEEAVLGALPRQLTDQQVEAFISEPHPDLIRDVLTLCHELFFESVSGAQDPGQLLRRRKAILHAHPELWAGRVAAFASTHDSLVKTVATYLEQHGAARMLPHLRQADESRLVIGLTTTALELGIKKWTATTDASLDNLQKICSETLADLRVLISGKDQ